ncbi:G-protein coupled receptor Mth2-like isoform X2 [Plodia interpunctella]|uniref:G-protein coupled receptor Mth2-like isoform X2 n=1 Tax=Plodia interpunctella TaxID=58824 RepID=UPI0023686C8A|nr:G-protein coupled receptor Mth2-like isoform X2 [Plodia interpunctella]
MRLLLCCIILFVAKASADLPTFQKCCPERLNLIKVVVVTNDTTEVHYQCLDSDVEATYNISRIQFPLIFGDDIEVKYGIPPDCDLQLLPIPKFQDVQSSNSICYDRLVANISNGERKHFIPKIVALQCVTNEIENEESNISLVKIRKCCPRGHNYDTKYHLCRKKSENDDEEWVINQVRNSDSTNLIYEVEVGLHCKLAEYAVELTEDKFTFTLGGSMLNIEKKYDGDISTSYQNEWCIDREINNPKKQTVARVCTRNCTNYNAFCLRKCCPVGQHFKPFLCGFKSRCVPNTDDSVLFDINRFLPSTKDEHSDVYGIRTSLDCAESRLALNISSEVDHHELTEKGDLLWALGVTPNYCLEAFDFRHCNADIMVTGVTCLEKLDEKNFKLSFTLMTISSVCLALTLLVYCALPELRNQHGRTLICHLCTMLLAFGCLARVQYAYIDSSVTCTLLAYGIYFGFVAAFAWLNVMCFDIWWTFGNVRSVRPLRKANAEKKRFIWYSAYAWSSSILLTVITFLLDKYPVTPYLDSNMGVNRCWFGSLQNHKDDWPHYIFFVIPMGIVTCINFVLWVLTARHCARVKSEVHRLQAGSIGERMKRRFRVDRAKYVLTGKLWVVMGAGWVCELLSTVAGEPKWLWDIVDLYNQLQGVLIFIILIFKPKLYYLARKRLGLENPDAQQNGTSSSGRTSSTLLSRSISADDRVSTRVSVPNNAKKK